MRILRLTIALLVVLGVVLAVAGCGRNDVNEQISTEVESAIAAIRDKRIFFGHQSVGDNVLDGLEELGLLIVDISTSGDTSPHPGPAVLHTEIGRNEYPDEKIADFAAIMQSRTAESTDVSFMKFCYVDSGKQMSADEILTAYLMEMTRLEAEFPDTTFVYLTMPLTAARTDIRSRIKRVLGMNDESLATNVERNRFNDLLRVQKESTGRLFDIAAVESTRPDGSRELFRMDGEHYEALVPTYTYDGGHLNELGRRKVAEQLVLFLAGLE